MVNPKNINLKTEGFSIFNNPSNSVPNALGYSASGVGDIDKDGYDDVIVGAPAENNNAGSIYIIYGSGTSSNVDLSASIFSVSRIHNSIEGDQYGYSVSGAGDFNGDGYDDVIIGAWQAGSTKGISIYGAPLMPAQINLSELGELGVLLYGTTYSYAASQVCNAGDVNGDGYDDIIIGSNIVQYVVYGGALLPTLIDLSNLNTLGFNITGSAAAWVGYSLSSAGDFNGDSYSDIIIGAPRGGNGATGYILYGSAFIQASVNLTNLGAQGITLTGYPVEESGAAGDINNDHYDDIILAYGGYNNYQGKSFILLGGRELPNVINLKNIDPTRGFSITGINTGDRTGCSVSGAGDLNNDGYNDTIIGAYSANSYTGMTYIVYGGSYTSPAPTLPPTVMPTVEITGFSQSKDHLWYDTIEFKYASGFGLSVLSFISAWLLRNKIAIYILDNWGHKYILYNPYTQLKDNDIAIKLSLNNQLIIIVKFREYLLLDVDSDSRGVSKALYNTIKQNIENPQASQTFTLLQYEKNQIRDYLIAHKYIKPTQTFGFSKGYTELGYLKGTLYNFFLQNFETNHAKNSKKQARKEDIHNLSIDQDSEELGGAFSATNPIIKENPRTENSIDIESSASGIHAMEIRDRDTKIESEAKTNQRSCVVCSIDAMMDPQQVRLQNEEFARFGRHLTYVYQDLAKLISEQFSSSQSLLKSVMPAEGANPLPETNFISNDLSVSFPRIQNAVEAYPLLKYISSNIFYPLVERYIPEALQNITFLEISNTMLVTAHMSMGHLYAWQQPQASVPFYIVESVAKSGSFAARLGVTKFINDYRNELEHNEQTITTTESLKHCVSTVLTYTIPDLLICAAAKTSMPGYECGDLNLGAKFSFAGSECYWSYKASQEPVEPNAVDVVVPYIADVAAGITAYANGYGLMGVLASVVSADWMSRIAIDMIPDEVEDSYIDLAIEYAGEICAYGADAIYNVLGITQDL